MEIKLKGRELPRNVNGDVTFEGLGVGSGVHTTLPTDVLTHFTPQEVVELVNRALYQLEYQRESHKKRGAAERAKVKLLKEGLKKAGKDPAKDSIDRQLKGE